MTNRAETNLAGIIASRAATHPQFEVLTFEGGGVRPDQTRNYAQLWDNGQRLAQALTERGLRPGQHFALLMANHAEFVDAMVAAAITGTVFVPIDPRTRGDKLAFMLEHAQCKGVIAADYALANLGAVRDGLAQLAWVIVLDTDEGGPPAASVRGAVPYAAALPAAAPDLPILTVTPDSPMQIIFSSGTTGMPKGIVMTHRRYCDTVNALTRTFGYAADERPYSGLSLTHANAQIVTLGAALLMGLHAVLSRRFTKSRLWDITRKFGCTTFTLLGGMVTAVYSEQDKPDDRDNPVRFVVSAGMPAAIWRQFEQRFGVDVMEFYGAAEGGLTVKPIGMGPVGSIGKPAAIFQHRIVDEDGADCPPGVPGEILFRAIDGAPYRVEYFGNPAASAEKGRDGWLHMGDIVRADAEGWLFFEHRKGGGIRRNGEFIDAGAIEKTIAECGLADDVFVYGVPAASGAPGEKNVVAAVVPKHAGRFDPQQLFRACRAALEASAVPSYLQVVTEIPKTASEKPLERVLVELFASEPETIYTESN